MRAPRLVLVLSLLAGAALAGCTGSDDDARGTTGPHPYPSDTSTSPLIPPLPLPNGTSTSSSPSATPEPSATGPTGTTGPRNAHWNQYALWDDPTLGDPTAPVVVAAFEAPMCGGCALFHAHSLPDVTTEYLDSGRAVLVFVQSTLGYDFDRAGGIAQECVFRDGGNDAFWDFTRDMYARQDEFGPSTVEAFLRAVADRHGLDAEALVACYGSEATADRVAADWDTAARLDVQGTPRFVVFSARKDPVTVGHNDLEEAILAAEDAASA